MRVILATTGGGGYYLRMGEVVDIMSKQPHKTGRAKCLGCETEWVAVAPIGCIELQCPECHLYRGAFLGNCVPAEGTEIWQCIVCDCDIWFVTSDGLFCPYCGNETGWKELAEATK